MTKREVENISFHIEVYIDEVTEGNIGPEDMSNSGQALVRRILNDNPVLREMLANRGYQEALDQIL